MREVFHRIFRPSLVFGQLLNQPFCHFWSLNQTSHDDSEVYDVLNRDVSNRDVSTEPLARPFVRSLVRSHRALTHCRALRCPCPAVSTNHLRVRYSFSIRPILSSNFPFPTIPGKNPYPVLSHLFILHLQNARPHHLPANPSYPTHIYSSTHAQLSLSLIQRWLHKSETMAERSLIMSLARESQSEILSR